jgi:hypothetical protein
VSGNWRIFEWAGTALQVVGALWLAMKLPSSGLAFPVMLAGSSIWMVIAYLEYRMSLFWMQLVFVGVNLLGIVRWLV